MSTLRANQEWDQLRADLAAATAELSGCQTCLKLQRDEAREFEGMYKRARAAHAATEGHLQSAREMRDTVPPAGLNLEAREELAETRKALARSEARVKELEANNERALKLCESLQRVFAAAELEARKTRAK